MVDVYTYAGAIAQCFLDGHYMGKVMLQGIGTNFEFENPVATLLEHTLGFFDVLAGVTTGKGPGHFQGITHPAAQQLAAR
ncbi:hypothetical protein D3C79_1080180 [compost metagenome]